MLEYYFEASPAPSWKNFAHNAEKVVAAMQQLKSDKEERALMRERARVWLND
jgi:hypothetical protein